MRRPPLSLGPPGEPLWHALWITMATSYLLTWADCAGAGPMPRSCVVGLTLIAAVKLALNMSICLWLPSAGGAQDAGPLTPASTWLRLLRQLGSGIAATLMGPCAILIVNAVSMLGVAILTASTTLTAPGPD